MWPLRIENPIFLQTIYGHYPDLSSVEITSATMGRDGPIMHLSFISTVLPYRPPAKWGAFNAVSFGLEFLAVESVSLRKFQSHGSSSIRMWDDAGKILLTCDGAVRLSLTSQSMRVGGMSGVMLRQ
ncbi:Imm50 family immunity protein [Mesorhizobium dulcispinae]|uniref:Imm50 family immunity protein n=1 Tax=Mesorhizobium dulcispinae TaxID=3072316 RepID=UPI002A24C844|nr:Imm50 family immunity protein [Mesorhizobium sp. VK23D]MDX8518807.1 Imm50 family immunity protein [Mesorhizobium sp. VK23D]